jgi:hypothetical protein
MLRSRLPPDWATVTAAGHPLVLGAAAVIFVNDLVLRVVAPGWLTGKLSDAAFLIVAPVFGAALLALAGVPGTWARRAAAFGTVVFYVALQLWPPLGAFFRASHVADVEDLLVLPAMFGAAYAWRRSAVRGATGAVAHASGGTHGDPSRYVAALALPLLAGALVATSYGFETEASMPCGEDSTWDPAEALYLRLPAFDEPVDTDLFLRGLRLTDADGAEVALVAARPGGAFIAVCAREGLRGDTTYTWEIGPWTEESSNELRFVHNALPTVVFHTLAGDGVPVAGPADCAALARRSNLGACGGGDTGELDSGADTGVADLEAR